MSWPPPIHRLTPDSKKMMIDLDIKERVSFADGHSFAEVGPYELIKGRAHYALNISEPRNQVIDDLEFAPVDGDGQVRFSGDVVILKPLDLSRGNGHLLIDLPNRGNRRALQFFNDAPASNDPRSLIDAGNGFLMRRGYTVIATAWQGDVLAGDDRMVMSLPIAQEQGKPLEEEISAEFVVDRAGVYTLPLSGRFATRSHRAVSPETASATLTRRRYPDSERVLVDPADWAFARTEGGGKPERPGGDGSDTEMAIVPSDSHLHLKSGFESGWIYELTYRAKAPLVLGCGYAGLRDLISFFRNDKSKNNLLCHEKVLNGKAYAWGRSQAGRFIRDFVYRGFNEDTRGRKVFDGVMSHIAGAGRTTPTRFSNLVIAASRQYENHTHPSDAFPFSYAWSTDHLTGEKDAILKRPNTDPLVIHSHTASEYWQRRGSLVHTDTQGNDLKQPDNVRIYAWASSQHWSDPRLPAPTRGICQNLINVVSTSMLFRSQLDLMNRWACDGVSPPASQFPSRQDGTLVTFEEWKGQFPAIPGVALPQSPNVFGSGARSLRSGHSLKVDSYAVLVPAVDTDGNDLAGVRVPMVGAPLGTYTGWNLRSRGYGEGAMHDFSGSYLPFPESPEHALATGDPRSSILTRYQDTAAYAAAIRTHALHLVQMGMLLEEDVNTAIEAAKNWGQPRHSVGLSILDKRSR